jgi:hypothetical protein
MNSKAVLLGVFEINRHGARTPKHFEERQKKLFFGSQNMQLTINGFRQEQLLGTFIKEKYIEKLKFLSPEYKSEEFCLVSSPTQRTIFSAAGFLSGLYPNYVVKNKYINLSSNGYNNIANKNGINLQNNNSILNKNEKNYKTIASFNKNTNNHNNSAENREIIKSENKLSKKNEDIQPATGKSTNNKLRNLNGEGKRLFAPLPDSSDKLSNNDKFINANQNHNNYNNTINKEFNKDSLEILNLKNEDSIPQLHEFTELEKKAVSFLSLEKKEIPLYIDNPLIDRLFHAWKCSYKGKPLLENLKNLNPIFDITEEEILSALGDFEKILKFNQKDYYPEKKFKNKKDKLLAIVKYYMSYIYHFKLNTNDELNKETYKTFKKFIINDWYSVLNSKNHEELKIPISEFFNNLLKHFQDGIKIHNKTLYNKNENNNGNEDIEKFGNTDYNNFGLLNKFVKFRVYSGHDTILINMLRGILDPVYIKDNLKRSLEDDNIFRFFVPEFGSFLIFELFYDDQGKYYFIKIIYNGMTIYDGIKTLSFSQEDEKYLNEIKFKRFEELMYHNINKDYESLDCNTEGEVK